MSRLKRPEGDNSIQRDGMQEWTRERDNRYRELTTKKENHLVEGAVALTADEEIELKVLDKDNTRFIEAGLKFQRGDGISTHETIVVLLGYAIGLGNIWRFPYLVGKFGGLSFLIAYLVCLVFVAHPVYMIELAFGQTMRKSTVFAFMEIAPKWAGVGIACMLALVIVESYYTVLLSYCAYYAVHSFASPLPWSRQELQADLVSKNLTDVYNSAAEYYFHVEVLGQNPNSEESGDVQGHLVLGLFVSYVIIYLAVFKGISFGAKITYFTVIVPAIFVFIISIRALALEGAGKGISYYLLRFDVLSFFNPVMWSEACAQTLFSLVFLPGTTVTLASYMKEKEDIYRINLLVTVMNTVFSFVSGLGVFAILGHVSEMSCQNESTCKSVDDFAKRSGPGLAFAALADGISTFGAGANFFSFAFFGMLFLLGLDTTFAGLETIITYTEDILVYYKIKGWRREIVAALICLFLFLTGIIYCVGNGIMYLDIVDHYVATYLVLIVSGLESWMMVWDMSWDVLATKVQLATTGLDHINKGRGRELPRFLRITCKIVVPLLCTIFVLTLFIADCVKPYGPAGGSSYSAGYQVTGWFLLLLHLVVMVGGGYYQTRRVQRDNGGDIELQVQPDGDVPLLDDQALDDDAYDEAEKCDSRYSPPPDPSDSPLDNTTGEQRTSPPPPPLGTVPTKPQDNRRESDSSEVGTGKTSAMRKQLEKLGEEVLEANEVESEGSASD